MAKIGLFNDEQEKWIQFDEDTEVSIRFLSKADINDLMKKATKRSKLSGGDADVILNEMVGRAAVKGWRNKTDHNHPGLLDGNGSPIPFSEQNLDKLMRCCREFSNFVNETAIDSKTFLEEDADAAAIKEAVKND